MQAWEPELRSSWEPGVVVVNICNPRLLSPLLDVCIDQSKWSPSYASKVFLRLACLTPVHISAHMYQYMYKCKQVDLLTPNGGILWAETQGGSTQKTLWSDMPIYSRLVSKHWSGESVLSSHPPPSAALVVLVNLSIAFLLHLQNFGSFWVSVFVPCVAQGMALWETG